LNLLSVSVIRAGDSDKARKKRSAEHLRSLFFAAYTNIEAALLALSRHVAKMNNTNINNLSHFQRHLLCEESEKIYLPLMEMLGLWELRRELGNLSLQTLDPQTDVAED